MVTGRTTMKSRKATKPIAVRPSSGTKGVQAPGMHHMSGAEVGARLDEVESRVLRAARRFAKVGRSSMQEALIAAKAVRRSMNEAFMAVRRAGRKIAKQVTAATQAV